MDADSNAGFLSQKLKRNGGDPMSYKERLEEIIILHKEAENLWGSNVCAESDRAQEALAELFTEEHTDWLIAQAEKSEHEQTIRMLHERKVRELEEENRVLLKQNNINYDRAVEYQKENERLRKALEFYADEINNSLGANFPKVVSKVGEDNGDIARQVLKGESK